MSFEFGRVQCDDEKRAVQHLRYRIYVEEMGRYASAADHDQQLLAEPEDDHSWIFFARDGDDVVAAGRVTWGGDGFSTRQIEQYRLAPFLDELPAETMAVGERLMVLPSYRGGTVREEMMQWSRPFADDFPIKLMFGCCEPHLLSMYLAMGQRPYADRNINSADAGYLIPLVSFVPDVDSLRGMSAYDLGESSLPRCVDDAIKRSGLIRSAALTSPGELWGDVRGALAAIEAQQISAFDGLDDSEAERCIARSNIIECNAGDRVLKRGGAARNLFVVLSGTLEVRDGDRTIGVLEAGDVFGEMAFLLERPRSFDVDAATDGVRVLSLSDSALRRMIAEEPAAAAKLLLNISKMLCVRLIRAD